MEWEGMGCLVWVYVGERVGIGWGLGCDWE